MAVVKWIKIVVDIFDDEKIKYIESMPQGDTLIVIWFRLLCMCGKSNQGGFLMMTNKIAYTDEMLASLFKKDIKIIQLALATFQKLEMIEIIDDRYYITNWEKHQNIDKLEQIRENNRLRVARHREKQKGMLECNVTETLPSQRGNALDIDIEVDKEKDTEKDVVVNATTEIFNIIESQMFIPITQTVADRIKTWKEQYSDELIIAALKKSILQNVRNLNYPDKILLEWGIKGIKTVVDIAKKDQKSISNYHNPKHVVEKPSWMNGDVTNPKNDEVDLDEVKKLIASFKEGETC